MDRILFDTLNTQISDAEAKQLLRHYLLKKIEEQQLHPERSEQIAYDLAGLMATSFCRSLPNDDPIIKMLTLAGELELPVQHRSGATWEQLRGLLKEL